MPRHLISGTLVAMRSGGGGGGEEREGGGGGERVEGGAEQ